MRMHNDRVVVYGIDGNKILGDILAFEMSNEGGPVNRPVYHVEFVEVENKPAPYGRSPRNPIIDAAVRHRQNCMIARKVIFNPPASIVLWEDGTKTVVKCDKDDTFDAMKGLALCYMKKALGNTSRELNKALRNGRKEDPLEKLRKKENSNDP